MTSIFRLFVAWILMGAVAAGLTFGPVLLKIVALGPISLAAQFLA
jgi:hypothetical protein